MAGCTKVLALLVAFVVTPTALCTGQGRSSSFGASMGTMSSTTRSAVGAPSSRGGGSTTRSGGSGMYGRHYGPVPEPDPTRKISEQDCAKNYVRDGGNLRCI